MLLRAGDKRAVAGGHDLASHQARPSRDLTNEVQTGLDPDVSGPPENIESSQARRRPRLCKCVCHPAVTCEALWEVKVQKVLRANFFHLEGAQESGK